MSRSAVRRLVSAALLLPLLTLSLATGGLWLRCRLTGAVARACCCAADGAEGAPAPEPARASAQDCCDRLVTQSEEMPFEPAVGPLADHAPGLAWAGAVAASAGSAADHLLLAAPALPSLVARARSAPTSPPALRARLVAKSSFLI
jgi:hypothetical protein